MSMRYWIILVVIGAAFGGSFGFNEYLLGYFGAFTVSAIRIALGAIGCWTWIYATQRNAYVSLSTMPMLAVFGTFQFAAPFSILPLAQEHIASSTAGIANALTPAAVLLITHIWPGGTRATLQKFLGALIGILGVSFLVAEKAASSGADGAFVLLAVCAPISYGIALNIVRSFRGIDPIVFTTWGMTFGAIVMLPLAYMVDGQPEIPNIQTAIALATLGLILTSAAFLIMYSILPTVGALNLSLVTFVAPVFALLIGVFAFNEVLSASQILGTSLILFALVVIDGRAAAFFRVRASSGIQGTM